MYTIEKLVEILQSEDVYDFKDWIGSHDTDGYEDIRALEIAVEITHRLNPSAQVSILLFIFEHTFWNERHIFYWAIDELLPLCNKQDFQKVMSILENNSGGDFSLAMLEVVARHKWDFLLDYLSDNVQRLAPGHSSMIVYVLMENSSDNAAIPLIIANNISGVWGWLADLHYKKLRTNHWRYQVKSSPGYIETVNKIVIPNEVLVTALSDERESVRSGVLWGLWDYNTTKWTIKLDEESIHALFNVLVEMFSTADLPEDILLQRNWH